MPAVIRRGPFAHAILAHRHPIRGSATIRATWQRMSAQALIPPAWSVLSQSRSLDRRPGRLRRHPREWGGSMPACPKCTHPPIVRAWKARGKQRWRGRGCGDPCTRATPRGRPLWQKARAVCLAGHGGALHAWGKRFRRPCECRTPMEPALCHGTRGHTGTRRERHGPGRRCAGALSHTHRPHLWTWQALAHATGPRPDWACERREAAPLKPRVDRLALWYVVGYCTGHGRCRPR